MQWEPEYDKKPLNKSLFRHIKPWQLLKKLARSCVTVLWTIPPLFYLGDFKGVCPVTVMMIMLMNINSGDDGGKGEADGTC